MTTPWSEIKHKRDAVKPTIVVDIDGTLLTNAWPALGEFQPGAEEAMHYLKNHARIVLYSCRLAPVSPMGQERHPAQVQAEINAIREKLDDAGLYTVEIHTDPWKPFGVAYVDDRAVRYSQRPGSWKALVPKLVNMLGSFEEAVAADDAIEVSG